MKVVYHPRYEEVYENDPAAEAGRMESMLREIMLCYDLVKPEPATPDDIRLVHTEEHLRLVQGTGLAYEIALLAAGGAIKSADLAAAGEPAFGLIRPPGHHASQGHCWGFCFFNNVAIAIARLRKEAKITSALILDIDLHYGDGTANIFNGVSEVTYFQPGTRDRRQFVDDISRFLGEARADIVAVSAGFDRHEDDWGGMLKTEDYQAIGRLVKGFAERACQGKRFGVLEGGYNHDVLGRNVRAFLEGMG